MARFISRKWMSLLVGGALLLTPFALKLTAHAEDALFPEMAEMTNTPQKRQQLKQHRQQVRSQVEAILSADQKAQLKTALTNGTPFREAVQSLNLSETQKSQLKQVFESAKANLPPQARQRMEALKQMNLSDAQKAQMKAIAEQSRSQARGILTEPQRQQLATAIANGEDLRSAMKSLNLSADQKAQLKKIMQASRVQMRAQLTPEQQAIWDQNRPNHRGNRSSR